MGTPIPRPVRIAVRLYQAALLLYPRAFRRSYDTELTQAFRARVQEAYRRGGVIALLGTGAIELCDLVTTAIKEHGDEAEIAFTGRRISMSIPNTRMQTTLPCLWGIRAATVIAFLVSLLASLNLYLLEDANPLTRDAYSASPLLRISYDGVYLSALAAGVAICAVAGYTIIGDGAVVPLGLVAVAIVVVLGGFGGLLVLHPA